MEDELDRMRSQLAETNKLLTLESRRNTELAKQVESLQTRASQLEQENAAIASGDVRQLQQEYQERAAAAETVATRYAFEQEYLRNGGRGDCFDLVWNSHSSQLKMQDGKLVALDCSGGEIGISSYVAELKRSPNPTSLFFESQATQPEKPSHAKANGASSTPAPGGIRQLPRSAMNDPAALRKAAQELGGSDPMTLIQQGKIQFI